MYEIYDSVYSITLKSCNYSITIKCLLWKAYTNLVTLLIKEWL